MPIFEYVCSSCANVDIELLKNDEFLDIQKVCTQCGEESVYKLSSPNWIITGQCTNPMQPKIKETENIKNLSSRRLLWDFYCSKCNETDERYIYEEDKDSQKCNKCRYINEM